MISFTYTVVRPDTTAIFAGDANPTYKGIVAARITMLHKWPRNFCARLDKLWARMRQWWDVRNDVGFVGRSESTGAARRNFATDVLITCLVLNQRSRKARTNDGAVKTA